MAEENKNSIWQYLRQLSEAEIDKIKSIDPYAPLPNGIVTDGFGNIYEIPKTGRTPLHFNALQWGNLEVAKALISQKADLNIKDVNGQTPLHYALASRKWNLAKLYIDSGADTSLKDKNNEGLDEYILSKGDIDAFKLFYSNLTPTTQELIKEKLTHLNLAP